MKRMTTICKGAALLLAVALLTLPLLGLAAPAAEARTLDSATLEQGLTFTGLIGMMDPPRPEVRRAVEQCYAAGIRPVMITGDHKLTAVAVAKELGIPFYDRDILKATVQTSGFDPDMVEHDQEDVSSTNFFFKSICSFADASFSDTQDAIHDVQKAVILHFAKEGPCVILGRCADEILREAGMESLNVFIHADAVHRAVRASELTGCTDATELQKIIAKKDNSRHTYYNHYTGKKWGDSHNYHLVLDSGKLGYSLCAKLIIEAAKGE